MSWSLLHRESEKYAAAAQEAVGRGDATHAKELFAQAANAEARALENVNPDKPRTLGITAVSAAALWYKAGELEQAERIAHRARAMKAMPAFAKEELHELLQVIRSDQTQYLSRGIVPIAYRETIRDAVIERGRYKKNSGGHAQFGDVLVEVAPRQRGAGFVFVDKAHGSAVPRQYFSSVEAGARDALVRGPLGFPVVDVAVTLLDGSYHSVDSSDMAFHEAAKIALREALPKARPVLLEPLLAFAIYVPSDALARAAKLVSARRGRIVSFESREGQENWEILHGLIPEAECVDLIVELRSATSGVGTLETWFDHLAELTGRAADVAITARKQVE